MVENVEHALQQRHLSREIGKRLLVCPCTGVPRS